MGEGGSFSVQCQEPKTGQEKVQLYCEDDSYCQSGYSLSMVEQLVLHYYNCEFDYKRKMKKLNGTK